MSSLQEQLLKAGLVDKNRANQADKEKQKRTNQTRRSAGKSPAKKVDPKKIAADKRHAERVARDRALDDKRSYREFHPCCGQPCWFRSTA